MKFPKSPIFVLCLSALILLSGCGSSSNTEISNQQPNITSYQESSTELSEKSSTIESSIAESSIEESSKLESSIIEESKVESSEQESSIIDKISHIESSIESSNEEYAVEIASITSPINAGETATLRAKGKPNTEYRITVRYSSGVSKADGLETKTSDSNGNISWSWKVGAKTKAGTYSATVSGEGKSVSTDFVVL